MVAVASNSGLHLPWLRNPVPAPPSSPCLRRTEQLQSFIEEHIHEPCYIMGNSLGGYLAVSVAANYPHLCKGLILLNATPFWSVTP